jgi:hypothetical protein
VKRENRKWGSAPIVLPTAYLAPSPLFYFSFFILLFSLFLGGCASPGEPTARKAPVPQAVTDLTARQSGNAVILTFTVPRETVDRRPLAQPPAIEIYRDFETHPGAGETHAPSPANPMLLVTIPAAMVDRYTERDQFRYTDLLRADDFATHPGAIVVYTVRARASAKKASRESNPTRVRVYPAPDPIGDVKAEVAPTAIVLTWTPPQKTPVGPTPPIAAYRIYRGEVEPGTAVSGGATAAAPAIPEPKTSEVTSENIKMKSPLAKIGESVSSTFRDTQAEFGKTYLYSIRSVVEYADSAIESADSNLVVVSPRDTFPPSAPHGLVVVLVPTQGDIPAHLELSWAVSPEADIAGYNIYRSEGVGIQGTPMNSELLLTPAFRDINVMSGHRYFYSVTAVDRSGNESPSSAVVSGSVPAESRSTP